MDMEKDVGARFKDNLTKLCADKAEKFCEIWSAVGHPNRDSRAEVVLNNIEELCNEMLAEETEFQNTLAIEIEELLKEADELCREVGGDITTVVSGLEDSSIPLLDVKKELNERMKDYRHCKQLRIQKYNELLEKEEELHMLMGLKKKQQISKCPTEEQLNEFSSYIDQMMEKERDLRQQFIETKSKIEKITTELGIAPDTSVHKMLVSDSVFCLSNENMVLLKELHQDMEQRLERAKSESIELREKLSNLWDRLHVDYSERNYILEQYPGYSKKSIDALKAEIRKCEEKKKQNIRVFVEMIRLELAEWWDKCCFGIHQRQQFRAYYSDCFTEDLLELHEIEVEKMKRYFNENIDILQLVQKREKLWEKMIELNERAHDPKRLFANRGGQLLREEKERKAIQKDLPILDQELNSLLDAYAAKNNAPFYYDGHVLKDLIKSKWDEFDKKKEEEKMARKKGKDQSVEKTLSATKRKFFATPTPGSVPVKVAKTAGPSSAAAGPSGSSSKVVKNIFAKKGERHVGVSRVGNRNRGVQSPDATYTDFQVAFEKHSAAQEMVRSSVVPSRVLRENRQPELSSIRERVATPAKPPRKNSVTRSCTNLSEFRTPQAGRAASPGLSRTRSAPRLAPARGRFPFII